MDVFAAMEGGEGNWNPGPPGPRHGQFADATSSVAKRRPEPEGHFPASEADAAIDGHVHCFRFRDAHSVVRVNLRLCEQGPRTRLCPVLSGMPERPSSR